MGIRYELYGDGPHLPARILFSLNCTCINLFASVWILEGVDILDQRLLILVLYLTCLILLGSSIGGRFPKRVILLIILVWLFASLYMLVNPSFLFEPVVKIFIPLTLFILMGQALFRRGWLVSYLRVFVNVVLLFSVVSLVLYVLGSCIELLSPTSYYVYDWSWISKVPSFFDLYFEARPAGTSFPLAKNCGIYPEPAMFAFSLGIALGLQSLLLQDSRVKEIVLLLATISTFSSTAFIFLLVLYGYKVLAMMASKNRLNALAILVAPVVFFLLVYLIFLVIEDKSSTGSYSIRMDHMFSCLRAFIENPFGVGVVNSARLYEYFSFEGGASVGILYLLATGGIECGLMLFFTMCQAIAKSVERRDFDMIVFVVLFFILFFMTNDLVRVRPWFVVGVVFAQYAASDCLAWSRSVFGKKKGTTDNNNADLPAEPPMSADKELETYVYV